MKKLVIETEVVIKGKFGSKFQRDTAKKSLEQMIDAWRIHYNGTHKETRLETQVIHHKI
jgi:hypothetical protein